MSRVGLGRRGSSALACCAISLAMWLGCDAEGVTPVCPAASCAAVDGSPLPAEVGAADAAAAPSSDEGGNADDDAALDEVENDAGDELSVAADEAGT